LSVDSHWLCRQYPQNIDINFALRVDTVGDVVSKEYVSVSGSILTEKAK
jgi:hypothetical protein